RDAQLLLRLPDGGRLEVGVVRVALPTREGHLAGVVAKAVRALDAPDGDASVRVAEGQADRGLDPVRPAAVPVGRALPALQGELEVSDRSALHTLSGCTSGARRGSSPSPPRP